MNSPNNLSYDGGDDLRLLYELRPCNDKKCRIDLTSGYCWIFCKKQVGFCLFQLLISVENGSR